MRIETDGTEVTLYDINGRQLNIIPCNNEVTITMKQGGLYLVRVGSTTRKVMVY